MNPVTRRSFLVTGSAGALGVAGAAVLGTKVGASPLHDDDDEPRDGELDSLKDPAVLNIVDAPSGQLELLVGERSVLFTDRRLVARLLRATR
jgi:hypothetical protein